MPHVQDDDVKKSIAKAKKAGAKIVLEYQSLGEMGAMGIFLDPAGASLCLWEAAPMRARLLFFATLLKSQARARVVQDS